MDAKNEAIAPYNVAKDEEDRIIAQALQILCRRLKRPVKIESPADVGAYFALRSRNLEHEEFSAAFLDAQNQIIFIETLATGTITQAAVYPREVVKAALRNNAVSVIFHHNHPSGKAEPSRSDEMLTQRLKNALELIDVRVLDHIVTGGADWVSFAERGMI